MAKVRRFSGNLKLELSFNDRKNEYRVRICPVRGREKACETVFVGPPRHLTRAVDSAAAYDATARAAPAFAKVWPQVAGSVARAENVRAALALVERGEAPLGIVYASDAAASRGVRVVGQFPASSHAPITYPIAVLRAAMAECGGQCHERFGQLELGGRKIAFLHGDDDRLLRQTIADAQFDLVCHGHTHQVRRERYGNTRVLNPGALFRARPHTLAIVQLPELEVEILPLELET